MPLASASAPVTHCHAAYRIFDEGRTTKGPDAGGGGASAA